MGHEEINMISIFELFKIGIGPSSSHTVGPMRIGYDFIKRLEPRLPEIQQISIKLYGSLAFTGHGHGTDKAIMLGLMGFLPDQIDPVEIKNILDKINHTQRLKLFNTQSIIFAPEQHIVFDIKNTLSFHSNAMTLFAYNKQYQLIDSANYYSIGGGFIVREGEEINVKEKIDVPYPFTSSAELLSLCKKNNMSIAELMLENEAAYDNPRSIKKKLLNIANVMFDCIERGCHTEGVLQGGLQIPRRAPHLYQTLLANGPPNRRHPQRFSWLNVYAIAVNEENAAYGRVVTAPTNGAAGIIPAVLNYYRHFNHSPTKKGLINFLLTAGAMGILYKLNASISGAEMGCQGEVGVACSMAAAGFAAANGGTIYQIENAAEIAMEHNLGLTCDPVNGLVQIPCIERNAMGAVKAVNAANLALAGDGTHKVSLDMVIQSMAEIGRNMNSIYKETSRGGLAVAVNVTEC